jgi:hypothetical protein
MSIFFSFFFQLEGSMILNDSGVDTRWYMITITIGITQYYYVTNVKDHFHESEKFWLLLEKCMDYKQVMPFINKHKEGGIAWFRAFWSYTPHISYDLVIFQAQMLVDEDGCVDTLFLWYIHAFLVSSIVFMYYNSKSMYNSIMYIWAGSFLLFQLLRA